jgi:hypothetical protein
MSSSTPWADAVRGAAQTGAHAAHAARVSEPAAPAGVSGRGRPASELRGVLGARGWLERETRPLLQPYCTGELSDDALKIAPKARHRHSDCTGHATAIRTAPATPPPTCAAADPSLDRGGQAGRAVVFFTHAPDLRVVSPQALQPWRVAMRCWKPCDGVSMRC